LGTQQYRVGIECHGADLDVAAVDVAGEYIGIATYGGVAITLGGLVLLNLPERRLA
jgi:hypothetical protein